MHSRCFYRTRSRLKPPIISCYSRTSIMILADFFCFVQSCSPAPLPLVTILAINHATSAPCERGTCCALRPCGSFVTIIRKIAVCARSISACDGFPFKSWRAYLWVATDHLYKAGTLHSAVSRRSNDWSSIFNTPSATSHGTISRRHPFTDFTVNWIRDFNIHFMGSNMGSRVIYRPRSRFITPVISCDPCAVIVVLADCFRLVQACPPAPSPQIAIITIINATWTS